MERQHISVVCFTGHKSLMGPQGTGGLCVGAGVEIRPFAVAGTGSPDYSETQPEAYPTRLEAGIPQQPWYCQAWERFGSF